MKAIRVSSVQQQFTRLFQHAPSVVGFSPGRLELIGNHIDYHGGTCVTFALSRGIRTALELTDDGRFEIHDLASGVKYDGPLTTEGDSSQWQEYVLAVVRQFNRERPLIKGLRAAFRSNLPIGSGLSSSAALEVSFAECFRQLLGLGEVTPMELAILCRRAENSIGVPCGILDQGTVATAKRNSLVRLECSVPSAEAVAAEGLSFVFAHCGASHKLGDAYIRLVLGGTAALAAINAAGSTQYSNLAALAGIQLGAPVISALGALTDRLSGASPEQVAQIISAALPGDQAILGQLDKIAGDRTGKLVPHSPAKCLAHVAGEQLRTRRFIETLNQHRGRIPRKTMRLLGEMLTESHASSRDNLEISGPELDALNDRLLKHPKVFGARMSGGGLGGCCVGLVEPGSEALVLSDVRRYYRQNRLKIGENLPPHFATRPGSGAHATRL